MAQILIVDDSPTEAHVLRSILERNGFDVETAGNGAKGIALARELRPDLVLMDVVMPGLNGFQATRQLSRDPETRGIPVIIVTTKDQDTDRVWGLRQGARDFLTKPVSEKTLMEKISVVLELV
ncbi:MAG: twitching motility response regulator PilH [Gammaproteobacteria bacterium]|jgi:twitching motility two-component system response regulator PilH